VRDERRTIPAMPVVHLREPLKRLAGGRSELALEGGSVGELLMALERDHPAAKGWLLDERGVLRAHINVFVNGERGAQDTRVGAGDRVDVLPAISGGS
jgi:molybdopterin synthase sulfur carrier subunit